MSDCDDSDSSASSQCDRSVSPELPGYSLIIAQQPLLGAAFKSATSRIPLSPPLVVEIRSNAKTASSSIARGRSPSQNPVDDDPDDAPFLVAHLSLSASDDKTTSPLDPAPSQVSQSSKASGHTHYGPQTLLMGTLVASPYTIVDANTGKSVRYFTFPDIAISREGSYKIAVNCSRLDTSRLGTHMQVGETGEHVASIFTSTFKVVSPERYKAQALTPFTQYLMRHKVPMLPPSTKSQPTF